VIANIHVGLVSYDPKRVHTYESETARPKLARRLEHNHHPNQQMDRIVHLSIEVKTEAIPFRCRGLRCATSSSRCGSARFHFYTQVHDSVHLLVWWWLWFLVVERVLALAVSEFVDMYTLGSYETSPTWMLAITFYSSKSATVTGVFECHLLDADSDNLSC